MYSGTFVWAGHAHWQSTTLWKYSGSSTSVGSTRLPIPPPCFAHRNLRRTGRGGGDIGSTAPNRLITDLARRSAHELLECGCDLRQPGLGVREEHPGADVPVELVLDAGVAVAHRALDHDDAAGPVDVEDRHAVDARTGATGRRVRDVVGADDEGDVGGRQRDVRLVQIAHDVVRDVGLGQQHVHV